MTIPLKTIRTVAAAVSLAGFAACTQAGYSTAPSGLGTIPLAQTMRSPVATQPFTRRPSWMKVDTASDAPNAFVYVALPFSVNEYTRLNRSDNPPACTIGSLQGAQGIGVDADGNVWVTQSDLGSYRITEFAPNCGGAKTTLTDPAGDPFGIAFDSKGTVYVANIGDVGSMPGDIQVYAKGSTMATGVLSDPAIGGVFDVAVDSHDNVYATFFDQNSTDEVIEFPGGAMPGQVLNLSGFTHAIGLTFDDNDNLIVDDTGSSPALHVYAPPYSGAPVRTLPLKQFSPFCTLGHRLKRLFCVDNQVASIDVYGYPMGKYLYSYDNGLTSEANGIATSPAAPN